MNAEIKPGTRLRSAVCGTEIAIIRARQTTIDLRCGGVPVLPLSEMPTERGTAQAPFDTGTQVGKRYADSSGDLEVLCTKGGEGSLAVGDTPLELKAAKALPSSD
ncbi:hypothetical protein [Streptomyces sp. NPDC096311]|uniref:hypothetical protein n=1 Tax=Streptomyces sp. NPDC096311 TaxID=3366083 RepID=UPI003817C718